MGWHQENHAFYHRIRKTTSICLHPLMWDLVKVCGKLSVNKLLYFSFKWNSDIDPYKRSINSMLNSTSLRLWGRTLLVALFQLSATKLTGGFFRFFSFFVLYSTLLHLPPLRFYCVGGCWDRTPASSDTTKYMQSHTIFLKILSLKGLSQQM